MCKDFLIFFMSFQSKGEGNDGAEDNAEPLTFCYKDCQAHKVQSYLCINTHPDLLTGHRSPSKHQRLGED